MDALKSETMIFDKFLINQLRHTTFKNGHFLLNFREFNLVMAG